MVKTRDQLLRLANQQGKKVFLKQCQSPHATPLHHLERYAFGETEIWEDDCSCIRIRQAETVYAEVEQTAAEILKLVAQGKCRYRDIGVVSRNMADYESVIETVFDRYGIPAYVSRRSDILEKPALSLVTGVLAAIHGGFEYEDMFRYLKTGLAGLTLSEVPHR